MRPGSSALSQWGLTRRGSNRQKLAVANDEYACAVGRREVIVYDAMTGEIRFKHENVLPQTAVFGNEHLLFLVPSDRNKAIALRATDGKTSRRSKIASRVPMPASAR